MPALNKNTLTNQVDLPTWEWCRFAPAVSSAISSTCCADNGQFNQGMHGRYIYYLISSTQFVRYDTVTDMYQQLASPPLALTTASSMRFLGAHGHEGNVLSATSTTLQVPAVTGQALKGFDVVIVSGTGAGQRRTITAVAEPVVHDSGVATGIFNTVGTVMVQDSTKSWTTNQYTGYTCRISGNSGVGQIRRIIGNALGTNLSLSDMTLLNRRFNNAQIFSPAISSTAGSQSMYSIESQVVTVDSAWTVTPDTTSVFRIQSGAIICATVSASAPWYLMQWYDVITDTWYILPSVTNLLTAAGTDLSLDRTSENSSIWEKSVATGGTTTTLVDSSRGTSQASWTTNQWTGYWLFIFSGTGAGQIKKIISNTGNTLTWSGAGTAPDATSRYMIAGFDAGIATSGAASTLTDSTKSWTTNQYANYAVRIVAGTGAGQIKPIVSNTATALTILGTWATNPDSTSVYQIQGDPDKVYIHVGGIAGTLVYNIEAEMPSFGKQQDFGLARTGAVTGGGYPPIGINSLSNVGTTATLTTTYSHSFRVGDLITVRGATDANFNVTNVPIATVISSTQFTYTMAGTPASTTLASSQSASTLCDASKNWTTNQWASYLCYMTTTSLNSSGSATGQVFRVLSNTATTLTFSSSITIPTNGTTKYVLAPMNIVGAADYGVAIGTQSTTSLQDNSKTWVVNQWANRRLRLIGGAAYPAEVTITSNTSNTLTLSSAITAPTTNVTNYAILDASVRGTGIESNWNSGSSDLALRGKYLYINRGGGVSGFDRYDITTDRWTLLTTSPISETLTTGSMSAYDGVDRIYFHKDATQRIYYLDVNTLQIHGSSMYPYAAPTAIIGNRMEIFTTKDGLRYLWLNRASFAECFRCLLYW